MQTVKELYEANPKMWSIAKRIKNAESIRQATEAGRITKDEADSLLDFICSNPAFFNEQKLR